MARFFHNCKDCSRCRHAKKVFSFQVTLFQQSISAYKSPNVLVLFFLFFLRTEFGSRNSSSLDKQLLTIYDLDNKFIAYSASFDDVIDVVAEWGSFYVLTRDGKIFVLQEKDTQTKLEVSNEVEYQP